MKKIIPFTNEIKFNTEIYEITSISLEHNLKLKDDNIIEGDFIVSGEYKITDSSINTEPFINTLPFEIELNNKYNTDKLTIDIDDFSYEVVNDEKLKVDISVKIEGIEVLDLDKEIKPDVNIGKEEKLFETRNEKKEIIEVKDKEKEENLFKEKEEVIPVSNATSIFDKMEEIEDEFVTYYVHIVRENDNIDEICNKYKVTKDDIKQYNDLIEITKGNKIIIPYINESI